MNPWKFLRSAAGCIALLLISIQPGRAGEPDPYAGPVWATLDPQPVLAAAAAITPAQYPDSDDALVDQKSLRVVHVDGTAETQDETYTKVLTEKGKRNNNTLTQGFLLPYMTVAVSRLEVIKPGGQVVAVDVAANAQESIDDSQMQANIYDPNHKVLRVNVPGVEIGDLVHAVVRTTIQRPILPGEFADDMMFEGRGFLRHLALEVRMPAAKPLRQVALRDEIPGTVTATTRTEGGDVIYHWEVKNVPRMFEEPGMPPDQEVLQHLTCSTTADWSTVSRWYWELSRPHLEAVSPEMQQQAAALTAGAASDREKISAVFYYVSKNIRYMGLTPEKDRPGFEPHDAALTYAKKYGVCRDKAALLVALLRAAGQKAYPVLVSLGLRKDAQVPNPFFNHAIVAVEVQPGQYQLMDPTDENTRDLLPSYEGNQSYLVCRPEGDTLRRSPVAPAEQSMMRISTKGTLSAAGALEAHSELSFDGINDNAYRDAFVQMKPDDRWRFFERALKGTLPGATLRQLRITPDNLLDTSAPVRAVIDFTVASTAAFGGGQAVVTAPWIGRNFGMVNFILNGTGLEQRRFPLQTMAACGLREEVSLRLDPAFTGAVSLPVCAPRSDGSLDDQRGYSFQDGTLSSHRELKLQTVEFSPADYLRLKQTLKEMQNDDRKSPVLAARGQPAELALVKSGVAPALPVQSDARVREERVGLRVQEAHRAVLTVRSVKEILNYSGKKKESEIKLEYNPAVAEARIVKAVVTAPDGKSKAIAPEEINVMDAGWNAGAKRYPGGRILVANLPGVEIGSVLEVEYEIAFHDKPYLAGFQSFQQGDEVVGKVFQLTAPAGLPRPALERGPAGLLPAASQTQEGTTVRTWTAAAVPALPEEDRLPPAWLYQSGVAFFAGEARDYFAALHHMLLERSTEGTKAQALARKLTATVPTRLAALQAVRDYVASTIRPDGPGFTELPLSALSAADTTLADGYGHEADRAILLHAMLTAAGFAPEFVLGSGQPAIEPLRAVARQIPLPYEFQAVLVKVRVDGQDYYLNDTDQYARLGATAHEGNLGINLADQHPVTIAALAGAGNSRTEDYHLTLDDTGKVRMEIRREYSGAAYAEKHKFFAELPPEEKNRYFQEAVSQVAQGARAVGGLITDFECYPGVEQFTVEVDHYAVVDGPHLYFDLPNTLRLFPADTDQRTLPLLLESAYRKTIHTRVDLPPGFRRLVIAPGNLDLTAPAGAGRARVTAATTAAGWSVTQELEGRPALLAPTDYGALLAIESALENKSSRLLLLEK